MCDNLSTSHNDYTLYYFKYASGATNEMTPTVWQRMSESDYNSQRRPCQRILCLKKYGPFIGGVTSDLRSVYDQKYVES